MVVGVPIKLLHESQGHIVTMELKTGGIYRGKLINVEDNMNVQLKDITFTDRDGQVRKMEQIYVRGSHIRYFIVPDMLKNAPMFQNVSSKGKGIGLSKGKATVAKAQQQKGRVSGPSRAFQ
jgi:small nuclear ribonucleoprotein D3